MYRYALWNYSVQCHRTYTRAYYYKQTDNVHFKTCLLSGFRRGVCVETMTQSSRPWSLTSAHLIKHTNCFVPHKKTKRHIDRPQCWSRYETCEMVNKTWQMCHNSFKKSVTAFSYVTWSRSTYLSNQRLTWPYKTVSQGEIKHQLHACKPRADSA